MQVEPTSGEEYSDFMFWRRPITTGPIFEAAADASRLRAPWRSIQPGRGRASSLHTSGPGLQGAHENAASL